MAVASPSTPATAAPRRHLGALARIALAVLAVGAAAFAGHLAAGTAGNEEEAAAEMSAGPVRLTAPAGWQVAPTAPSLGALPLNDAAAARAPSGGGIVVAGMLRGVIFPQGLGRSVDPAAPAPDAVRLGRLEAYRWRGLEGEDGPLTLMAAPTAMGTALVACEGSPAALRQCERAPATLRVPGAEPTPLDALAFYASEVEAAFGRLEGRRRAAIGSVSSRRMQSAYERAARSLGDLAPPAAAAEANERLIDALERAGAAYGDVARAARLKRRGAYGVAARRAEGRERELRSALAEMVPPAP